LPRAALDRRERDRAAPGALRIEHRGQPRVGADGAANRGGDAKGEIGADFGDRELDRTVAEDLKDQVAGELDVGVHEHAGGDHLAEQAADRLRPRHRRVRASRQHFAPAFGEADEDAAHGQAVEDESVQFTHEIGRCG
jgi:hypothetical protein